MKQRKRRISGSAAAALAVIAAGLFFAAVWFGYGKVPSGNITRSLGEKESSTQGAVSSRVYTASDFSITAVHSPMDFNRNGTDDYTDILLGARKDAENRPRYDAACYKGGYPPENAGACTDVVWRAFRNAGYSLKDMVDRDIRENRSAYPGISSPDPDIDFRRVKNLKVYFERHAVSLTTDLSKIAEWQPGDIVTFGTNHIGVISDKRNAKGVPYLIHNWGQPEREEDAIERCGSISGHFRFDASKLKKSDLIPAG